MNSLPAGCDFCNEFSGSSDNSFDRIYEGAPSSRVLLRCGRFAVVPSLGQIAEGHLLVLPFVHYTALGDMDASAYVELESTLWRVGRTIEEHYGPYVLFEHGTRSESAGGCGIYHAHMHVVPFAGIHDPIDGLTKAFSSTPLKRLDDMGWQSSGLTSYLFYQDTNGGLHLFDPGPLPSQYARKLLAEALGQKEWDWRSVGRETRLLATLERLSGKFDRIAKTA